jgi:hypothetical protein
MTELFLSPRTRIHCRAARYGAARGPFDHFEIRANTLRFVLLEVIEQIVLRRTVPRDSRSRSPTPPNKTLKYFWNSGFQENLWGMLHLDSM